jgi:hypothetical protein
LSLSLRKRKAFTGVSDAKGLRSTLLEVVPGVLLDIQTLSKMLSSDAQEAFLLEAKGYTHKQTAERIKKAEADVRRLYMKASMNRY